MLLRKIGVQKSGLLCINLRAIASDSIVRGTSTLSWESFRLLQKGHSASEKGPSPLSLLTIVSFCSQTGNNGHDSFFN